MVGDLLFDAGTIPTREAVRTALGDAADRWDALVARVEAMGARGSFTWDGPKDGWSLKYWRAASYTARTCGPRGSVGTSST